MQDSWRVRETQRVFILFLAIRLVLFGLEAVLAWPLSVTTGMAFSLRLLPVLLAAPCLIPLGLGWRTGARWLAAGLGLDVVVMSVQSAPAFFAIPRVPLLESFHLPEALVQPPIEPFFFLLVPLVLAAWAFGRRGALLASSWATLLHLALGVTARQQGILAPGFVVGAVIRIALLYSLPLLIAALARRERHQHAELEQAHARLRRHAATVEQLATLRERNRLARDLHDTLAHSLAALSVQLEALRTVQTHDPAAAQEMAERSATLARQGLADSRQAIQSLRTDPVVALGLAGALRNELADLRTRTGVEAQFIISGEESDLSAEEEQVLYRIATEALYNAERHARARAITTRLAYGTDRVDVEVSDDGQGFDPATVAEDRYGLTGMRERAALVGAQLVVTSRPGQGTVVRCILVR